MSSCREYAAAVSVSMAAASAPPSASADRSTRFVVSSTPASSANRSRAFANGAAPPGGPPLPAVPPTATRGRPPAPRRGTPGPVRLLPDQDARYGARSDRVSPRLLPLQRLRPRAGAPRRGAGGGPRVAVGGTA